MKIFITVTWATIFMTDVMHPAQGFPTGEQHIVRGSGPDATDHMAVAERLRHSVPLVVAAPEAGSQEGDANPFSDTDALLAKWGIGPDGKPLGTQTDHQPRHYRAQHTVPAAVAEEAALAMPVVAPVVEPKVEAVAAPAAEPEPVAELAAPIEVTTDDAQGAVNELRDQVVEELEAAGQADLAEAVETGEISYDEAYDEAVRQLKAENPRMSRRKLRNMAHDIAEVVTQNNGTMALGFEGEPDDDRRFSLRGPEGSLRRKAADLLLRAGVTTELAQQAAAEKLYGPERKGFKLALGALGIVAVAATGLYLTYKGIKGTVSTTVPNMEMFQPDSVMSPDSGDSLIASR